VPLAVWPCQQTPAHQQRDGRYLPESSAHPAAMLPELARRIITAYSHPGQLVVDPMCGIGTTLVEAAALDRRAIGIDPEDRWAQLAIANAENGALTPRQQRNVEARTADARDLSTLLIDHAATVDLIVTSPPLGHRGHGRRYGAPANLGDVRGRTYEQAMAAVYAGCYDVLRPGGLLVTVTQNTRRHGQFIDLAGLTTALCQAAGFGYLQHVIALLAAVRDEELAACSEPRSRPTATDRGAPVHQIAHQDVLVFAKPQETSR
jgi:DNA modification methylase